MTKTNSGRNIEASITLRQRGLNGKITAATRFEPRGSDYVPPAHEAMAQIVAVWLQLQTLISPEDEVEGTPEYVSTLTLSQDEPEGPVYSKLVMDPRVKASEHVFPSSYEASSYLATAWLQMAGVIDEAGNVLDEDSLDTVEVHAKEQRLH